MTRLLILACLGLLASCSTLRKLTAGKPKKETPKAESKQVLIGTIDLVNPDQRFVLIRTIAHVMLASGTELTSTNAQGQVSKLKVTPEHKGSYLAADIVSGTPQRQDAVTFQATSNKPPAFGGEKPVRGGVDTISPPAPSPAPFPSLPSSPSPEPLPSEFLRPIPPQAPLPNQSPQ